jgi:hypothetical protein
MRYVIDRKDLRSAWCRRVSLSSLVVAAAVSALVLSRLASAQQIVSPATFAAQSNGNFGGTIPIHLPPATGGLAPSLAITYSSHSPNGLLGLGFSLQGLSAVTRCGENFAQDGVRGGVHYDANDRFCLDGQRLVPVSGSYANYGADGTEYRTELDSFSQIISHGTTGSGPTYFTVKTKSGLTETFGNTPTSGVLANGLTSIRTWAVSQVSDTAGNYYAVTYTDDSNGAYYPNTLSYTGNGSTAPQNTVVFSWATRGDNIWSFTNGSTVGIVNRLASIQITAASQPVRIYNLTYDNGAAGGVSRLLSVQECAANGGSNPCMPAIPITWNPTGNQSGTFVYNAGYVLPSGMTCSGSTQTYSPTTVTTQTMVGNFGGSGRADLLCNESNDQRFVLLSNGDGTFRTPTVWQPGGHTWCNWPLLGDVDGDGKTDLVCQTGGVIYVATSVGDGTFTPSAAWPSSGSFCSSGVVDVVDIDGDGRADLLCDNNGSYQVALSNGNSTFTIPTTATWNGGSSWCTSKYVHLGDFDGDGKTDLLCAYTPTGVMTVATSNGDGSFSAQTGWMPASGPWCEGGTVTLGDFNGDGKTDMLCVTSNGAPSQVAFSAGNGSFVIVQSAPFSGSSSWCTTGAIYAVDINGDGKADLVCATPSSNGNTYSIAYSKGDGSFTPPTAQWPTSSNTWCSSPYLGFGDATGDGQTDLLCYASGQVFVATAIGGPDLVTSVGNGMGAVVNVNYQPLTAPSVYTKDTGSYVASYPLQDTIGPYYVVSSVSRSNGIGGLLTTNYAYGGLKVDLSGRGSVGFRTVQSTDAQTSIVSSTIYNQVFPYTGLPATASTTLAGQGSGGLLKSVANTYQCYNPATGAGGTTCPIAVGNRYFPALQQAVTTSYDLNGAALPTSTTTIGYDTTYTFFGNVKTITTSNSDGYSKTTTNTYNAPDLTHWWLGQVNETQVTSTTP